MINADHCGVALELSTLRNMHRGLSAALSRLLSHRVDDAVFNSMKGVGACLDTRRAVWSVFDG